MGQVARHRVEGESEPVRVLGRGLRAQRGVHLTLRTLREATGKAQVDVANDSHMDQADISRLESRADFDDCQVSTLQRYIAAIGGQLEVVAVFENKRIILSGVTAGAPGAVPSSKTLQRTGRKAARR